MTLTPGSVFPAALLFNSEEAQEGQEKSVQLCSCPPSDSRRPEGLPCAGRNPTSHKPQVWPQMQTGSTHISKAGPGKAHQGGMEHRKGGAALVRAG